MPMDAVVAIGEQISSMEVSVAVLVSLLTSAKAHADSRKTAH